MLVIDTLKSSTINSILQGMGHQAIPNQGRTQRDNKIMLSGRENFKQSFQLKDCYQKH